MNFPIPVVAEAGALQKALGLPAVKRTATHNFENGRITIRTQLLPTPSETGAYSLYYLPSNGAPRCVIEVRPEYNWGQTPNGSYKRTYVGKSRLYLNGALTPEELPVIHEIVNKLEAAVDAKLRRKGINNEVD